jgi:lipopolysaccharide transport system ATP-binding protein
MSDTLIKIEGLHKKFCMNLKRSMLYGTVDMVKGMFGAHISEELRKGEFWALQDINFELKKGEILGLIGKNGCGKTTLLRLISGIFPPDKGLITINGSIGSLIALGAGFHPHMTGRENIWLNGSILGMSKIEINSKLDSIIEFADISDFIDAPVSTYSSGMTVRLGFSIAIHCSPEILLVDEVLAVGDFNFQYKCFEKIKELKQNGTAIVFVSHSENSVKAVCTSGILMDKGKMVMHGEIDSVLDAYNKYNTGKIKNVLLDKNDNRKLTEADYSYRRGNGKIRFTEVYFCDGNNEKIDKIPFNEASVRIVAKYFTKEFIDKVRVAFTLRDATKTEWVWVYSPLLENNIIENVEGEGEIIFDIDIRDLGPNIYGLYIVLSDTVIKELAYDVWDINGTILEIESNLDMIKRGLSVTKPYVIRKTKIVHNKLQDNTTVQL